MSDKKTPVAADPDNWDGSAGGPIDDGGWGDDGNTQIVDAALVVHDKPETAKQKQKREGQDKRDTVDSKTAWNFFTPLIADTLGQIVPVADDGWCWWHAVAFGLNALQQAGGRPNGAKPLPDPLSGEWTPQKLRAVELTASKEDLAEFSKAGGEQLKAFTDSLRSDDKSKRWGDPQIDGRLLTKLLGFSLLHVTLRQEINNGETSIFYELISGKKGGAVKEDVIIVIQYDMHVNAVLPVNPFVGYGIASLLASTNQGRYVEGPSTFGFKVRAGVACVLVFLFPASSPFDVDD